MVTARGTAVRPETKKVPGRRAKQGKEIEEIDLTGDHDETEGALLKVSASTWS